MSVKPRGLVRLAAPAATPYNEIGPEMNADGSRSQGGPVVLTNIVAVLLLLIVIVVIAQMVRAEIRRR